MDIDKFRAENLPKVFNYDLGSQADQKQPEFVSRESLQKIESRVSQISASNSRDVDSVLKERGRLVEFKQAYNYESAGRIMHLLCYFKSISNIFDLEFFTNKLASSANSMVNVEKMVLSGVPFLDEGDDALLEVSDDEESDGSDTHSEKKKETF